MSVKTVTNRFGFASERKLNPYIGFMSFQRFSGDPLYSDCVVKPENNMCETESYECYPVPSDVEQKGDSQGFYPESSLAYIRFLWKEFEPERGVYNYQFIEDIFEEARAHGQQVILRIMAHSTRARDDVPEWLRSIVECPERPDGKRVKDSPTDPKFIELFLEAVKRIGERFDGDPNFYAIDISLPGAWGEGHKLELYPDNILEVIVDVYTSVFRKTRLFGQVGRPGLLRYANQKITTGWRGDGFGHPLHMDELYPPNVEKVKDMWRTVPVSFESFWWLGEWKRQGWDIDAVIEKSLEWHISSFNGKSLPIPFEWRDKVEAWISKMGYHFVIGSFTHPKSAEPKEEIELSLDVYNKGVAPIYTKIPLVVRLSNEACCFEYKTDVDIRRWLPGNNEENFSIKLGDLPLGEYKLSIGITGFELPSVVFCTDAPSDGDFSVVGRIEIK